MCNLQRTHEKIFENLTKARNFFIFLFTSFSNFSSSFGGSLTFIVKAKKKCSTNKFYALRHYDECLVRKSIKMWPETLLFPVTFSKLFLCSWLRSVSCKMKNLSGGRDKKNICCDIEINDCKLFRFLWRKKIIAYWHTWSFKL